VVAEQEPDWLERWVPAPWFERYGRRVEEWRLPGAKGQQEQTMVQIGCDGSRLLAEIWGDHAPAHLRAHRQIAILRTIWAQQFFWHEGQLSLRSKDDLPPAHRTLRSPYDPEAQYGHKRDQSWYGYKVHCTETCDERAPHLITHVVTTAATATDVEQTGAIHQALGDRGLAPSEHLLDAGYVDAELILQSRDRHGVTVIGPVSRNVQWQAKAQEGYDLASFTIDWQQRRATCPQGKRSVRWTPRTDQHGHPRIAIRFGLHDCRACPTRSRCTRSATAPRILAVRTQAEYEALRNARESQRTAAFHARYAQRSGVEGTHSQGVRALGLRRTRYIGLVKTTLHHVLTAAAINLIRLDAFLAGTMPAHTRTSHFAALAPLELAC
jgi:transposase